MSSTQQTQLLKQASYYMLDVLEDLTLFERLQTSRMAPQQHLVDLQQLADDVVTLLGSRAEDRGVALEVHLDTKTRAVATDRRYVLRILVNLAGNALNACARGEWVALHVDHSNTADSQALRVTVNDGGCGLDAETLSAIKRGSSAGYGFTVVRDLVNALGGWFDIQSVLGEGTTVTVNIPVSSVSDYQQASVDVEETYLSLRLLLIEDLPENRLVLSTLLEAMGHTVTPAASLAAARMQLEKGAFDVVLVDRRLPDGDGIEALPLLQASALSSVAARLSLAPRFIMLTADAPYTVKQKALSAGYEQVLSKPVTEKELQRTLAHAHAHAHAHAQAVVEVGAGEQPAHYLHLLSSEDRDQVVAGFYVTACSVRNQLKFCPQAPDTKVIAAACHMLIGSAECVGEWALANLARHCREKALHGDPTPLHEAIERLTAALDDKLAGRQGETAERSASTSDGA